MSSRWLSSSISGLSSAVHTLAGSQAGSHPDADLADEDAHLANKSSGSRSKANSSHSASSNHASTSHSAEIAHTTPEQTRLSPRARAASGGSTVLTGILENHPSFSVFRKSASLQSLDSIASSPDEPVAAHHSNSSRSTPSKSPGAKRRLDEDFGPGSAAGSGEGSDEWHLSSVEEMESLNWGDRSGDNSGATEGSGDFGAARPDDGEGSAVRLVQYDSPPSRRTSTSRSPRPSTQLQFSPLSLAPSPLLGVPPPPPPPALESLLNDSPTSSAAVRTILKLPRTPGTGQSVRFSASTRHTTPPSMARFADADLSVEDDEGDESLEDAAAEVSAGSRKVEASFLSKLQAAIPSPESSIFEQPSESSFSSPSPSNPLVTVSSPTEYQTFSLQRDLGHGRPPLFAEDESNLFDISAPHFSRLQSVEDWSIADAAEKESPELDSPEDSSASPSPSPAPKPRTIAPSPLARPPSPPSPDRTFATSTSSQSTATFTPDRSTPVRRSTSFYRQFLKKRASSSQIAADELGRLIETEGEKTPSPLRPDVSIYGTPDGKSTPASPASSLKRSARDMDEEDEEDVAPGAAATSVYYSPATSSRPEEDSLVVSPVQKKEDSFEFETDSSIEAGSEEIVEASLLRELGSEHPDVYAQPQPLYEAASGGYAPPAILPAIYEESEPNTTVDSISFGLTSPPTIVPFGSNPRRALSPPTNSFAAFQSTTVAAGPVGHRRSQSESCAPSPNPFASQSGNTDGLDLIHQLISAQGDQLANGSSQRFLLSSLITNLRDDIARRDAMLENMKQQKDEAERFSEEAFREAAEWEQAAREGGLGDPNRAKLEALEDLVENLTDELEMRTALDQRIQKKLADQIGVLQVEVQTVRSDVRDGEIRLRHARASQAESEAMRSRVERERDELREQLTSKSGEGQQFQRERDDLRARLRREVEDRDAVILDLRSELAARPEANPNALSSSTVDAELERRVEEIRAAAIRDAAVVRAELEAQVHHVRTQAEVVADLRAQNRTMREDLALLKEAERQLQSAAELARLEHRTEAARLRAELGEAHRARTALEDDLDELQGRIDAVQDDKERQLDSMRRELDRQRSAWQETRDDHERLLESIALIEADAADKHAALQTAHDDLATLRRETNALLDDRDSRLAEAQTALATKTAKMDAQLDECNRLKELVGALRRGSNERDDKITRLQKAKAELSEDIMGLNIALESKQQEAALWKRQAATASRIPTPSSRPRSALGSSVASSVSRRSIAPATHNDTPIKAPRRHQKLGFGSSVRRSIDDSIVDSPSQSKENVRPVVAVARQPTGSVSAEGVGMGLPNRHRRSMVAA